jgi:putative hydrolase
MSDGVLLPSEIAVRYLAAGYKAIAITDHTDYSNIEQNIASILAFTGHWPKNSKINVLPGLELTHLPLSQIKPLASYARRKGMKVIIAHGETQAEPVISGTNKASLEADIDILAHPGLISDEDVRLAKRRGIYLEITSRKGHKQTNAHVVEQALKFGAKLILNNDSHDPVDIISPLELAKTGLQAGLNLEQLAEIDEETAKFVRSKLK